MRTSFTFDAMVKLVRTIPCQLLDAFSLVLYYCGMRCCIVCTVLASNPVVSIFTSDEKAVMHLLRMIIKNLNL